MHPSEGAAIGGRSRNENIRMTSQVGDPFALGLCVFTYCDTLALTEIFVYYDALAQSDDLTYCDAFAHYDAFTYCDY
jgi:hypothetical protein